MFVFMKTVFANLGIECQLQFKQNIGITLQGQVIVNQFEAMAVHGPLGGEGKGEKGSRLNCESHKQSIH
ncbi:hypothetical protein NC652_002430 [Populus alba x Populus x berolinensis]|nr:hypothetical protein NC652_002430 [Populus alba x Populus x berolinensis]